MKFYKSLIAAIAVVMPVAALAQNYGNPATFRNLVINGEALVTNAGTATLTGVNTTPTYAADGVAVFANNASASVVAGTSTANIPNGFQKAFSVQRTASNTDTHPICFVQEIESARIIPFQGQSMTFSAYLGNIGTGFSAAGNLASFTVISGTGTDEGLATLLSGWAGASTVVNASPTTALTTAYQRFGVNFTVPNTAKELALEICYTPVGTASSTTDQVSTTGWQLETVLGNCPAVPGGAGYTAQVAQSCTTPYEHKGVENDTAQSGRYFQQYSETAAGTNNLATGQSTSTTVAQFTLELNPVMRCTPTLAFTAGGWKVLVGTTATAITSGPAAVASSQAPYAASFTATTGASQTLGQGVTFQGSGAGTGIVTASCRF